MRNLDKFKGCMYGGAIGDALGAEIEFYSEEDIFERFGERGITEYVMRRGVAEWSDDTQMTLFTATGLLSCKSNDADKYARSIYYSYRDWYKTQTEAYPLPDGSRHSWLANIPALFSCRAPGRTCLSALSRMLPGTTKFPINQSKGCGGIMRVAPIGLYFCDSHLSVQESDRLGAEAAAITHGHELGWLPAVAQVHILRVLSESAGATIKEAALDSMEVIKQLYPRAKELDYLLSLMQRAIDLSEEDEDDLDAIHLLGRGNVAEETLAIALYCSLKYSGNFEKGIIAAVNHGGDSDSTGAVTGNILGAALGINQIPNKWTEPLEMRSIIETIADDLYRGGITDDAGNHLDPFWKAKYDDMSYPFGADD